MDGSGETVKIKCARRRETKAQLDLAVAKHWPARQRGGEIQLTVCAWDALRLCLDGRQTDLHAHQVQRGVLHAADLARKCHYSVLLSLLV